ncbi:embryonic polarity protein dorsal-like [Melitaea cinxia]|uniref:embryonic polarity protein dorsal-like n=1 Tax=Melitaea cinxia TaxID=113334 RepID=UPI001E26F046|nr:embryonic polarity protein dorsal-like [Melitaea cinxia]
MPQPPAPRTGNPYVRIVEQPASKALRFRYECEGRSAGSIPGVNSVPERKTYPTIEICGHRGPAIVVVSCVTREEPYKPHPHNLVGRERCDNGVCTVKTNVTDENPQVSFSNLGIQCVKRKDIAEALKTRERLRVDPFRTGYNHRNQPQSIDLNAVRLCFQVFIHDERTGKIRLSLPPVVSDVIYDKKAMSDLVIMRLSQCSDYHRGGTELILLCEKVTREDIAVVFFEKEGEQVVWEESANIVLVHRQVAIAFQTPPYRDPRGRDHVQVYLQLKRTSDNARSNAVPFEYIPEYQGTARKPLPDLSVFSLLLSDPTSRPDGNNNDPPEKDPVSSTSDSPDPPTVEVTDADVIETNNSVDMVTDPHEKSLDDLLDQVAELDEIYSENRTRLENVTVLDDNNDPEDFDDAGTYTSLQLAFKNPVPIAEPEPYEDVQVHSFRGPIIEYTPLKRDPEDERAPPLPPKRVRKTTDSFKTSQTSVDSILKPGRQLPVTRNPDTLALKTELGEARSEPALPPPSKKRSFFSRLFRRRDKSPAPSVRSEGVKESRKPVGRSVSSVSGLRPSKFKSAVSHASLKDNGSGISYADSITHISLHGDGDERSLGVLTDEPLPDGTILVAESVLALDADSFRKLRDDLELTEAEHYALYMAVAPKATASEFDETSCYYSPVDGSKFHNDTEPTSRSRRSQEGYLYFGFKQHDYITCVMSTDKTPTHQMNSPLAAFSPSYEHEQVPENIYWGMPGLSAAGPSHVNYGQEMQICQNQNYVALSPGMQSSNMSPNLQMTNLQNIQPNLQTLSPSMHTMSPMSPSMQTMSPMSPNMQTISPVSPNMQMSQMGQVMTSMGRMSPMNRGMSPNMGQMSPNMGHVSPAMGHVSPAMGQVSPAMGHISPNLAQQQHQMQQQQDLMDTVSASDTPSITGLLMDRGDMPQLNSGELSGLSALLENRGQDLSDSLNRLSTSDLLQYK